MPGPENFQENLMGQWQLLTISVVFAVAILAFDLNLPLGIAGGVPYIALVLLGIWSQNPFYPYRAKISCVCRQ